MFIRTHTKIVILVFKTEFIIHYITIIQLQNDLIFVVVDWGYSLTKHNIIIFWKYH